MDWSSEVTYIEVACQWLVKIGLPGHGRPVRERERESKVSSKYKSGIEL